ncbi:hypothetical protein [Paraburkholderia sp. J8-2]|uniref:hypothetical protein n=1 Tax=Paraburkholderia sp. J8-2 TaxID=2805440 RepID=UPI002AB7A17B|nr:hypothetical protein [Paraburkholderia sp. J8-2]
MKLGKHLTPFADDMVDAAKNNNGVLIMGNYLLSSVTDGGTLNPLTMDTENSVVCVVKYRGIPFGLFQNGQLEKSYKIGDETVTGTHAEDCFMSAWEEFQELTVLRDSADLAAAGRGQQLFITLKINKSPCIECTAKLIKFKKANPHVSIRLKILQLYYGSGGTKGVGSLTNRLSILALMSSGFYIKEWVIFKKANPRREQTKLGYIHELRNMTAIFLDNTASKKIFSDEDDQEIVLNETELKYLTFRRKLAGDTITLSEQKWQALEDIRSLGEKYRKKSEMTEAEQKRHQYLVDLGFDFEDVNLEMLHRRLITSFNLYKHVNIAVPTGLISADDYSSSEDDDSISVDD